MEKWRSVWRQGFAPQLSARCLVALEKALAEDDLAILQGSTCYPPLLDSLRDRECEGACIVAYGGWKGLGLKTVGEVEEYFQNVCDAVDQTFNEPAMVRYLLNWYDDTPRSEMRREMLAEVRLALQERRAAAATHVA